MAVTKQLTISEKSHIGHSIDYILSGDKTSLERSHIANSIDYITQEVKTKAIYTTGLNCNVITAKEEFDIVKKIYGKEDGLQGHHVIQSFKPGEVDPERAHEIGIKLAERIAPGYQVVISTHIDKEHIHNHLVINSVNMNTGYKYDTNKKQYNFIREESDKLCKEYNLSIVEAKENSKGLNQATYQLAEKGMSWKVKMINFIDEAIEMCNSQEDFIKYMEDMGYEIKYQNENISFKDPDHVKFIRAKTLAKEFGEEYSKEMIENRIRGFKKEKSNSIDVYDGRIPQEYNARDKGNKGKPIINIEEARNATRRNKSYKNEYERYEQYKTINSVAAKATNLEHVFNDQKKNDTLEQEMKLAAILIKFIWNKYKNKKTSKINIAQPHNRIKQFSVYGMDNLINSYVGNIPYNEFSNLKGNKLLYTVNEDQFNSIKNTEGIKYAAMINPNNTYDISIKSKDKDILNRVINNIKSVNELSSIRYSDFKKLPGINKYLEITQEEYSKLKNSNLKYAAFKKDDGVNLVIKIDDMQSVLNTIGRKFELQLGNISYKALKDIEGNSTFRVISNIELEALRKTNIRFAAFSKDDGKINISFKEKDLLEYTKAINSIMRDKPIKR